MLDFILDNREKGLHELLPDVKTEPLDIGDFVVNIDGAPMLVLERKTVADLVASICDGRYAEQKQRLKALGDHVRIIYLIEGCVALDDDIPLVVGGRSMPNSTLVSCTFSLSLKDRFHVFSTSNIKETAKFLQALMSRISKDPGKYFSKREHEGQTYIPNVRTKKKENNSLENCFIVQLCAIPGISHKKANAIIRDLNVHSMKELCNTLTSIKTLQQVDGIGKQLAHTVYNYLGLGVGDKS